MKKTCPYWVFALFTVAAWASIPTFTKLCFGDFSPNALGFLRTLFAFVSCLILVIVRRMGLPPLRDWPKFFLSGGFGFFLNTIFINQASSQLNSATINIFGSICPVLVSIMAWIFLKERVALYTWVAFVVEFAGILLLVLWNGTFTVSSGLFWMIGSVLAVSSYNLSQRMFVRRYTPIQATAYSVMAGTIPLFIFLPQLLEELPHASTTSILSIAYMGIVVSCISYIAWNRAFAMAQRTSDVTNFMFLMPAISALLGFLVLGETPTLNIYVGGAVVLAGMGISAWGVRRDQSRNDQAATFCPQKDL